MKPFIWKDGDRWFVSPRNRHQVLYWKPYPDTERDGYPTLVDAFDDTVRALTLAVS